MHERILVPVQTGGYLMLPWQLLEQVRSERESEQIKLPTDISLD